jgi:hypothetical protein
MHSLRDRWQRGPIAKYFAGLDRCDQATFIIITALAFAIGVSFSLIATRREPAASFAPASLTAPPFDMNFAAVTTAGLC